MLMFKKFLKRSLALILCVLVLDLSTYISAFATSINETSPISNEQIEEAILNAQIIDSSEDSTFVLAHSNVDISDTEYFPETADINELEEFNANEKATDDVELIAVGDPLVGDEQVCMVQKWLNQEYQSKTGAALLTENGRTSSYITNALTRALQYEMGMTSYSNSWGPNTGNLYSENILQRQDGVVDNKYAILQAALWCKGYSPGYYFSYDQLTGTVSVNAVFNESVENAIIRLKGDMGLSNQDGTVTLNVMKALMSMDDFKKVSGGDTKIREMQQKLNRKYEPYFTNPAILPRLSPCDGIYSANTNRALIYAFQAEEGLPVGTANGSYGSTTRKCTPQIPYNGVAKSYSGSTYSSSQISAFIELLKFALYVNGFDPGSTNGVYDSQTQQTVCNFQKEHALPITGKVDLSTWMSLLVSSGNRDRTAIAADCATILTAQKAQALFDAGYRYVGRYLTGTYAGGISKALTREEIQNIFNAGLNFWPIYQTSARANTYFTPAQGAEDAKNAIAAASALGIPRGTIIYFAVDFDAMDYQVTSNILPYFEKVHEEMSKSIYRTGVYGARNICSRVSAHGYACSSFVGNISTGFSGNIGYPMPSNWAFDQFTDRDSSGNYIKINSPDGSFEIDKDGFSGRDLGVEFVDPSANFDIGNIDLGVDGNGVIEGPNVEIMGNERPLFKVGVGISIGDLSVESKYDHDKKILQATFGYDHGEDSEEPANNDIYWQQQYGEIKELVEAFGGKTTQTTYNNFRKMRKNLKKVDLNFGFDFDTYVIGYVELDFSSGSPELINGKLVFMATAKTSLKYQIYPPVPLYVKFEVEGSLDAGFKLKLKDTGELGAYTSAEFSLIPRLGAEIGYKYANAFGGISGELSCAIDTEIGNVPRALEDVLTVEISASLFFEYQILSFGNHWDWEFANAKLYPNSTIQQTLSMTPEELQLIEPLPETKTKSISLPDVFKDTIQIYAKPQIISLENGNMFMTYIDDSVNRTAANSSILMYSIFNGTSWSEPLPVHDDGTADFEPMICSDGNNGVHILWQNSKTTFNEDVTLEEMAANIDLFYTHWNEGSISNTVSITSNNKKFESSHKIVSSGNSVSVIWKENSENDLFDLTGTNSIFRKQCISGAWQNIETVSTGLPAIVSMDTAYNNSENVIAYTTNSSNDNTSVNDLEVYYIASSQTIRLTNDNAPDYSVSFLNNELFWISNNSIVTVANGDINSKTTVIDNMGISASEIKAIGNSENSKSIVWAYEDDTGMTFYGTHYNEDTGTFGAIEPLVTSNGVVRGWDACKMPDGQVELAYCYADYLEDSDNSLSYGTLSLIQKPINRFYDIAVDPIATYENEIVAGQDITLFADVYNTGSQTITQLEVTVFDENNVALQTIIMDQSLSIGESIELQIPFTLPSTISKTDYRIQIMPIGGDDNSPSDNEASFSIGFADIAITDLHEERNGSNRNIVVTVKNQGFNMIDSASLKVLEGSIDGFELGNETINQLVPGSENTFTFELDENNLIATESETPRLFYLSLETTQEESDYGNNSKTLSIYPDYIVSITAGAGGTVSGSGIYMNNSSVAISAVPLPGYVFVGWYENDKLIEGLPQACNLTINHNRNLEARFSSTDLSVSIVSISGSLMTGKSVTFTAQADGGSMPYKWSYTVYKDGVACNSKSDTAENTYKFTPSSEGMYTIMVTVTDGTGYTVSHRQKFYVEKLYVISCYQTISFDEQIPSNAKVRYWTSSNKKVASVDENGIVKGMRIGETTITAHTQNGGSYSYNVEVKISWWQIVLIFTGIGALFIPIWFAS